MSKSEITCSRLRRLLDYNPETGVFKWQARPKSAFKSGGAHKGFIARCQGKEVGHVQKDGYIRMKVDGRDYFAHRLAWLYVHGVMPSGQIDHINRVKTDNRIDNLRDVPPALNSRNRPIEARSKTGIPGVHFEGHTRKWVATINEDGDSGPKRRRIGTFSDLGSAVEARLKAESKAGYLPHPTKTAA